MPHRVCVKSTIRMEVVLDTASLFKLFHMPLLFSRANSLYRVADVLISFNNNNKK